MLANITVQIEEVINSLGSFGPIVACLVILIESIVPVIPLFAFITINFIAFGNILGFIISWLFTCLGCFLSYYLVRKGINFKLPEENKSASKLSKCIFYVKNLSLPSLCVILAIPFTPAFMMNIAAGLCKMSFKKFAISILVGKIFLVYFWGYIGVGLIESFQNPVVLIDVAFMMIISYILGKLLNSFIDKKNS